jgi:hypothetical protein
MHENIHLALRGSGFVTDQYRWMLELSSNFGESPQCRIVKTKNKTKQKKNPFNALCADITQETREQTDRHDFHISKPFFNSQRMSTMYNTYGKFTIDKTHLELTKAS